MNIQTVAAAISSLAEDAITEGRIDVANVDAMAAVMGDAEQLITHELVRGGMSMAEASALASQAALLPARATAASDQLKESAFRNRHAGVPDAANEAGPTVGENASNEDPSQASVTALPAVEPETSSSYLIEDEASVAPAQPAPPRRAAAARPATPALIIRPEEPKPLGYKVVDKKVHEIFNGVDAGESLFNFKLPVLIWDRPHLKVPKIDPAYSMDMGDLLTALYAVADKRSTNLVGPHGCGKTEFVKQIAARLNFPVTTLPMDGQLTRSEMIGREKLRATSHGNESYFSLGRLPRAMAEPGFILFDEVDRGTSDLQYACHSVYLQEGLSILEDGDREIPFHAFNRVWATANTKGRGSSDGMYIASEEMSEATRDRLSVWIEMDYQDAEQDTEVLVAKLPHLGRDSAEMIAEIAAQIRAAYKQDKISQTCSLRQQLEVGSYASFLMRNERDAERRKKMLGMGFDRIILGRASAEDKEAIKLMISTKLPDAFKDPLI